MLIRNRRKCAQQLGNRVDFSVAALSVLVQQSLWRLLNNNPSVVLGETVILSAMGDYFFIVQFHHQ